MGVDVMVALCNGAKGWSWQEGLGNRLSWSVRLKDGAERELVMLRSYHTFYNCNANN
jgi:hypothetical protein